MDVGDKRNIVGNSLKDYFGNLSKYNMQPWSNVWNTRNEVKHTALNENFYQNGAKVHF